MPRPAARSRPIPIRLLLPIFGLGLCQPLPAADFANWTHVQGAAPVWRWLDFSGSFRIRSSARSGLEDLRVGGALYSSISSSFTVRAGYYESSAPKSGGGWTRTHRPYTGFVVTAVDSPRSTLRFRTLYERFLPENANAYNRYRQRVSFKYSALPLKPFARAEALADRHGLREGRFAAGCRFKISSYLELIPDYMYVPRAARAGRPEHVLELTFRVGPYQKSVLYE